MTTRPCRFCRSVTRSSGWWVYLYLYKGATVVFGEAIDTLGRDMQQVRPTIMTGVPRVYEKLRARIIDAVAAAATGSTGPVRLGRRRGA